VFRCILRSRFKRITPGKYSAEERVDGVTTAMCLHLLATKPLFCAVQPAA